MSTTPTDRLHLRRVTRHERYEHLHLYQMDGLTEDDWLLLLQLSFEPFEFAEGDPLTYGQWSALGEMAFGRGMRRRLALDPLRQDDPNEDWEIASGSFAYLGRRILAALAEVT